MPRLLEFCVIVLIVSGASSVSANEQIELSGREYWYHHVFFSGLKSISVGEETITGLVSTKHGEVPFIVRKDEVFSPDSKTQGYILALESFISLMRYGETEPKISQGGEGARELTGKNFLHVDEWEQWLVENRRFLFVPESEERLLVDVEARQKGSQAFE